MKTITDLTTLIKQQNHLINEELVKGLKTSKYARQCAKLRNFYIDILAYLISQPTEEFLLSEKKRVTILIHKKEELFNYYLKHVLLKETYTKQDKAKFNKEMNITNLKKQLKNINFILKK